MAQLATSFFWSSCPSGTPYAHAHTYPHTNPYTHAYTRTRTGCHKLFRTSITW